MLFIDLKVTENQFLKRAEFGRIGHELAYRSMTK